jgi:hypothetical protein
VSGLEQERADVALDALRRGPANLPPAEDEPSPLVAIEGIFAGLIVSAALWAAGIFAVARLVH